VVIAFATIIGTIITMIYYWFYFRKVKKVTTIDNNKFRLELNKQQEVKNVREKRKEKNEENYRGRNAGITYRGRNTQEEIGRGSNGYATDNRRESESKTDYRGEISNRESWRETIQVSDAKDIELHDPSTL